MRNSIERLRDHVANVCPNAVVAIAPPLHADGVWSLEIGLGQKHLAVEWSDRSGFGISTVSQDNFAEGPDEVVDSLDKACRRISQLLVTDEKPSSSEPWE